MIVLSCFSSRKIRKFDLVLRSTKQQFMAVTENLSSILGQGAFSPIADTDRIPRIGWDHGVRHRQQWRSWSS